MKLLILFISSITSCVRARMQLHTSYLLIFPTLFFSHPRPIFANEINGSIFTRIDPHNTAYDLSLPLTHLPPHPPWQISREFNALIVCKTISCLNRATILKTLHLSYWPKCRVLIAGAFGYARRRRVVVASKFIVKPTKQPFRPIKYPRRISSNPIRIFD